MSSTVRVNISAVQLAEPGLLEAIDSAVAASGVDPALLCVEITETALLRRTATVTANLAGIHDRGISLAIDDFGTGSASLTYLDQYPVGVIKIDRSFISHRTDHESAPIPIRELSRPRRRRRVPRRCRSDTLRAMSRTADSTGTGGSDT